MLNLPAIPALDEAAQQYARARQSQLTKPDGALGRLETLSIRLVGMTGRLAWLPTHRAVVVCAGDHGVVAQGVSAYPQSVTAQMVTNFLRGSAAINVLARQFNTRVKVVDAGVAAELEDHPDLIHGKIERGTADLSVGAAMTPEQAEQSLRLGMDIARREIEHKLDLLAVGDMGIGNTTAASAVIAAITGAAPTAVTGRGTGIDDERLRHKTSIIERSLSVNQPTPTTALEKVGGFEIGTMAGLMIGAATARVPVVIDGLISAAAALIAARLNPAVTDYLIAGHRSVEPGHIVALQHLQLEPLLNLDLRLGEGTGAVLAFPIIEAAMRTLQEMATFEDAGVSQNT